MTLALLASCAPEDPGQVPENGIERMSARQQLIRVSVDLRGIHPTEDELAFIEEQPWAYDEFVDRYIADERFLDRVEEIFNYRYLTRTGETYFDDWDELALGAVDERRLAESIANEPLKLLRYTVDNDLPYSYVITANHTMSDPLLAEAWRLDYPDGEEGWQMAQYQDGRPMAGILSMTTTWVRYPSAGVNGNRHRANQMSRLFLCDDYLSRPVSFSRSQVDALTTGDPNDVIANTPTCQSCHSSLDPLAAHFFGFWWEVEGGVVDQTTYRQEDEEFYRDYGRRSMAYYGVPTANISEMAGHLAEDPRFADCAVQTVFDGLTQRTTSDADWSELRGHRDAFMAGDMNIKDLVLSIVTSEEYRARAIDPDVNNDDLDERVQNVKMVTPAMLSSVIADKTGYRWQFDGRDGLAKNERGLAVLSGGIDGRFVRTPSHDPSVGMVLIQERLAQAAGWHVAQTDLRIEDPEGRRLLKYVNLTDTPELNDDAFDYQIRDLYLQLTGLPLAPEATEPAELKILWKQLYSLQNSPEAAWAGIVSVVLRDPLVLFY
jgi:hypothetical protein